MKVKRVLGIVISLIMALTMSIPMTAFGAEKEGTDGSNQDQILSTDENQNDSQEENGGGGEPVEVVQAEQEIVFSDEIEKELASNNNIVALEKGETRDFETKAIDSKGDPTGCAITYGYYSDGKITISKGKVTAGDSALSNPISVTITAKESESYKEAKRTINVIVVDEYDGFSMDEVNGLHARLATFYSEKTNGKWNEISEATQEIIIDIQTRIIKGSLSLADISLWHGYKFVKEKIQTITIPSTSVTKTIGEKAFSLGATFEGAPGNTLQYSSDKESVATVNANGQVTILGIGTAKIKITAPEKDGYQEASKTVTVTVKNLAKLSLRLNNDWKEIGKKRIRLIWGPVTGATSYQIYAYAAKKKNRYVTPSYHVDETTGELYFTNTKLKKKKTYKYKIRAVTVVNGNTFYGPWSDVKKAKCKK